jgi:hypothetical protein
MTTEDFRKMEERWKKFKFLMGFGIFFYFILLAVVNRRFQDPLDSYQIRVYVPYGLILIFISFYIFRENDLLKRAKRINRIEKLNAHRNELLNNLFAAIKRQYKTPE